MRPTYIRRRVRDSNPQAPKGHGFQDRLAHQCPTPHAEGARFELAHPFGRLRLSKPMPYRSATLPINSFMSFEIAVIVLVASRKLMRKS